MPISSLDIPALEDPCPDYLTNAVNVQVLRGIGVITYLRHTSPTTGMDMRSSTHFCHFQRSFVWWNALNKYCQPFELCTWKTFVWIYTKYRSTKKISSLFRARYRVILRLVRQLLVCKIGIYIIYKVKIKRNPGKHSMYS